MHVLNLSPRHLLDPGIDKSAPRNPQESSIMPLNNQTTDSAENDDDTKTADSSTVILVNDSDSAADTSTDVGSGGPLRNYRLAYSVAMNCESFLAEESSSSSALAVTSYSSYVPLEFFNQTSFMYGNQDPRPVTLTSGPC